jgi:hypothetical protein
MTWIQLAQDKNLWLVNMYTVIKYGIPDNTSGLLSRRKIFNYFLVFYLVS